MVPLPTTNHFESKGRTMLNLLKKLFQRNTVSDFEPTDVGYDVNSWTLDKNTKNVDLPESSLYYMGIVDIPVYGGGTGGFSARITSDVDMSTLTKEVEAMVDSDCFILYPNHIIEQGISFWDNVYVMKIHGTDYTLTYRNRNWGSKVFDIVRYSALSDTYVSEKFHHLKLNWVNLDGDATAIVGTRSTISPTEVAEGEEELMAIPNMSIHIKVRPVNCGKVTMSREDIVAKVTQPFYVPAHNEAVYYLSDVSSTKSNFYHIQIPEDHYITEVYHVQGDL